MQLSENRKKKKKKKGLGFFSLTLTHVYKPSHSLPPKLSSIIVILPTGVTTAVGVDTKRGTPEKSHPVKTGPHCQTQLRCEKQLCASKKKLDYVRGGGEVGAIPVSGLMLFCGCVAGAGLLRECAWTGVPEMGCWAAAD